MNYDLNYRFARLVPAIPQHTQSTQIPRQLFDSLLITCTLAPADQPVSHPVSRRPFLSSYSPSLTNPESPAAPVHLTTHLPSVPTHFTYQTGLQ